MATMLTPLRIPPSEERGATILVESLPPRRNAMSLKALAPFIVALSISSMAHAQIDMTGPWRVSTGILVPLGGGESCDGSFNQGPDGTLTAAFPVSSTCSFFPSFVD